MLTLSNSYCLHLFRFSDVFVKLIFSCVRNLCTYNMMIILGMPIQNSPKVELNTARCAIRKIKEWLYIFYNNITQHKYFINIFKVYYFNWYILLTIYISVIPYIPAFTYCISVVSLKFQYPGMCIARKIVPKSYYHRDIDNYFLSSLSKLCHCAYLDQEI